MFGVRNFPHQFNSLDVSVQQWRVQQQERLLLQREKTPPEGEEPLVEQKETEEPEPAYRQNLRIHPRRKPLRLSSTEPGRRPRPQPSKHASFRDKMVGVLNANYDNKLDSLKRHMTTLHDRDIRRHDDEMSKLEYELRLMQFDLQRNALSRVQQRNPTADHGLEERRLQNRAKYLAYDPAACGYLSKKNNYPCRSRSRSLDTSATVLEARKLLSARHEQQRKELTQHLIRERSRTRPLLPGTDMMADMVIARKKLMFMKEMEKREAAGETAFLSPKLLKFYLKHTMTELNGPEIELLKHWDDHAHGIYPENLRWDDFHKQFFPSV